MVTARAHRSAPPPGFGGDGYFYVLGWFPGIRRFGAVSPAEDGAADAAVSVAVSAVLAAVAPEPPQADRDEARIRDRQSKYVFFICFLLVFLYWMAGGADFNPKVSSCSLRSSQSVDCSGLSTME